MILAYNRTMTPLPANAAGRMIEGRSEGQVDDAYAPVQNALASGSLRALGDPEDPDGPSGSDESPDAKASSSPSTSEKKSSSAGKKKTTTSSKKADEPDEEN